MTKLSASEIKDLEDLTGITRLRQQQKNKALSELLDKFFESHIDDIKTRKPNLTYILYNSFTNEHPEKSMTYDSFYRRLLKYRKTHELPTTRKKRDYLLPSELQAFWDKALDQLN